MTTTVLAAVRRIITAHQPTLDRLARHDEGETIDTTKAKQWLQSLLTVTVTVGVPLHAGNASTTAALLMCIL